MHTLNKVINSIDILIKKYVNKNYSSEEERQRIRIDFLEGFEEGFEFVSKKGVPNIDYWERAITSYRNEGNLIALMLIKPHEFGGFMGSLICTMNNSSLARQHPYHEILEFLRIYWPQFHLYIQTLIS